MNFFDAQDNARKATRWLLVAYALATLLIAAGVSTIAAFAFYGAERPADPAVVGGAAVCALLLIVGATLYKTAVLGAGGAQVARQMGGTPVAPDTQDPLRKRLRNVVEEMAIASGVPVPEIYVLERETGINAFAAGHEAGDAAIAVTRGTLELLSRDELQGVIAHEFSHILNGDMRINLRMMGVLFGIMVLGLIGRLIVRGGYHGSLLSSRRGRNAGGIVLIGFGLVVLGWIGVFIARIVKAAVSRQRETLADASAVQFTRQTDGIAGALKKIAGYVPQSYIQERDPEEVSHMLFARGSKLSSLFATHPPLAERIHALDPSFDESQIATVDLTPGHSAADDDTRVSGFSSGSERMPLPSVTDSIGNPGHAHIAHAAAMRGGLPALLYDAAHSTGDAWLLCLAVFLPIAPPHAERADDLLTQKLGAMRAQRAAEFRDALAAGPAEWRLTMLSLAFPALKQTPAPQLEFLLELCRKLIDIDGHTDLHEFCLYRVLALSLEQALSPASRPRGPRPSRQDTQQAALSVLALAAIRGNDKDDTRRDAYAAGVATFGRWAGNAPMPAQPEDSVAGLDAALDVLMRMTPSEAKSMIAALAATISADGRVTANEAELLRAVCASLGCPVPPLAGGS